MKKLNVRHTIGDEIISLITTTDSRCQQVVKGHSYIVRAVTYCPHCGLQSVNLGEESNSSQYECFSCRVPCDSHDLMWTRSKYFVTKKDAELGLASAIKDEEYDVAILLRDILNENKKQY